MFNSATLQINPRTLGIAALLLATSGWGGMFLVSKGVLHHVDPVWFTMIRYTLSGLAFSLLLAPRGAAPWRKLLNLRSHAIPLALRGFAGFGMFSTMLLIGLTHSVPSHGAIIMATTPMSTQLMRWALDGVRPKRSTLLTTALALAGVAIVSGLLFGSGGSEESTLYGDTTALIGTLGWVWYTRGATRFADLDVIEYTALTVLASWPVLLVSAIVATIAGWAVIPNAEQLTLSSHALLYVGFISSAVSILAFNFGVRTLGAVTATAFLNFVPVSVLLMSVAMGKLPSAHELVGMAMVVAALLIHTVKSRDATTSAAKIASVPAPARASVSRRRAASPAIRNTMASPSTGRTCANTP
jgi:drug/metabolite transporter (DMT)-like permease